MFPRPQRLTANRVYAQVFRRGTWQRGKHFSLVAMPATKSGQIGFIITKKITKSAVLRNQTKRRVRATFQALLSESAYAPLAKKYYIVVVLHRLVTDLTPVALHDQAQHLLDKLAGGTA